MRKGWIWAAQAILAAAVAVLVAVALRGRWEEFRSLDVRLVLRPEFVVAAVLTVWATYALLIEAWRRVIMGWGGRLDFPAAARIWCLANLGRYLPGKVWSIAGLVVLAKRAGVSGWTAAGSALVMQVLAAGTGAAVVAAVAPGAVSVWGVVAAAAAAAATLVALVWEPVAGRLVRLLRSAAAPAPLPAGSALAAAIVTLVSWGGYGVAFWLLARGILPGPPPPLAAATGVFAAGYLLGLLALFAPGGIGVREVVLVALLTSTVGPGPAVALSVAARLLLTVTEAGAALVALALGGGTSKEEMVDAGGR